MKYWKKITAVTLSVLLVAFAVMHIFVLPSYAREAKVTLSAPEQVKNEETFAVKVTVDSDTALAAVDIRITYDPSVVAFESDESGIITGSDGMITLSDLYVEETYQKTYTITFRAIAVGNAEFGFDTTSVTEYENLDELLVHSNTQTTEILENKKLSTDATLANLLIANGSMDVAFASDIFTYNVKVDADVDTLIFSSIPSDEEAVVVVDKPDFLVSGSNTITITVTAPAGNANIYTIIVNK